MRPSTRDGLSRGLVVSLGKMHMHALTHPNNYCRMDWLFRSEDANRLIIPL